MRKFEEIRRSKGDPAREARVAQIKRAMEDAVALAELREAAAVTQVELASRLGRNQSTVSRIERQDDLYLSTLREYVEALGGELDLVARFGDGSEVRLAPTRERSARSEALATR
jgi:transcriptional regulator with XRE-family HTH domain